MSNKDENHRAAVSASQAAPKLDQQQDQESVMPPTRGTDSQRDADFSSLLGEIMNLPCRLKDSDFATATDRLNYKTGHRDARHDACDLVSEFASRFRAQGGDTNDEGSASQAVPVGGEALTIDSSEFRQKLRTYHDEASYGSLRLADNNIVAYIDGKVRAAVAAAKVPTDEEAHAELVETMAKVRAWLEAHPAGPAAPVEQGQGAAPSEKADAVGSGDEDVREAFEAWHRSKFATKYCTGQPTRDMHNGIYAEQYGPKHQQQMWEAWQAARSDSPAPVGVGVVPEGWQLVPKKMTRQMVVALSNGVMAGGYMEYAEKKWGAMLAAAPTAVTAHPVAADDQVRDQALEDAAKLIEATQETITANGANGETNLKYLTPRKAHNLMGLAYAEGIRALKSRTAAGNAAAPGELVAKLERVSKWINKFPVPTEGATAMMRHLHDVQMALLASTAGAAPVDALRDGYEGGIATKNNAGPYVRLYYKTMAQAEAAFDVLLNMVDPSNTSPVGAERKAP